MKFGPVPLADAEGALLAHGQHFGRRRLGKGHRVTAADLAEAAAAGLRELVVARLEPGDVAEDEAAATLAAALAGPGLVALAPVHGRVNLAAEADGLFTVPAGIAAAINDVDEAITLATLPDGARVTAGTVVATVKTIRYAVERATLSAAVAAARPLALAPFRALSARLIATRLPGTTAKALARLEQVTQARLISLGASLHMEPPCPHDAAALAQRLAQGRDDLLLIAGASATVDRGDVIPQAIEMAGGTVERLGMPVDPGNLLVLGSLNGRPVIGLPGCARSPKRNGLDLVIERIVAGQAVTSATIAAMGEGGLLPEAERPEPRAVASAPRKVGAVVLAAGRASRMGGPHKLLETWQDRPIIAHVIDAIAASGLPPPVVVLGHDADAVRTAMGDRPAHFVMAQDWAEGMGRSLASGIAAVPADWDAAMLFLADIPRIEPILIQRLASTPGQIVLPVWDGRRGHPVRWPRAAFARLMALAGDVGGRAIMDEFPITSVPAPSDAVLDDIDTPAALARLRARG